MYTAGASKYQQCNYQYSVARALGLRLKFVHDGKRRTIPVCPTASTAFGTMVKDDRLYQYSTQYHLTSYLLYGSNNISILYSIIFERSDVELCLSHTQNQIHETFTLRILLIVGSKATEEVVILYILMEL